MEGGLEIARELATAGSAVLAFACSRLPDAEWAARRAWVATNKKDREPFRARGGRLLLFGWRVCGFASSVAKPVLFRALVARVRAGKRAPRRKPTPSPSCAFPRGASSAALLNEAPNWRGEGRIGAGVEPERKPVERVSARSVSRPSLSRVATRSCVGRACVWLRQSQSYYLTSHHPCSSPPS